MSKCEICKGRLAIYRCRRCGRRVCEKCLAYHGLCIECQRYLTRTRIKR